MITQLEKLTLQKTDTEGEISLRDFRFSPGVKTDINFTYSVFGCPLHSAPIVLVNHALTGNSRVAGERGWWNRLIGPGKTVDTEIYTVLAFNIPGNGFSENEDWIFENYKSLSTRSIANLFWKALDSLRVRELFAVIGGSLGGAISWEMAFLQPDRISHVIPIAVSLRASDWLIANTFIQENILKHSLQPVEDARKHAMLMYRTPGSFRKRFQGRFREEEKVYEVESWLNYHGRVLEERFTARSYLVMNHLLKTVGSELELIDIVRFSKSKDTEIHLIGVDSDLLFTKAELLQAYRLIKRYHENTEYLEIKSPHGHDAFLMEYEQLKKLLKPIFKIYKNEII